MSRENPRSPAWARYYANHPDTVATWGESNGREPNCSCNACDPAEAMVAKLRAQLDEDERLALAAPGNSWQAQDDDSIAGTSVYDEQWRLLTPEHHGHDDPLSNRPGATGPAYVDAARDDLVNHIAHHDPARVLADVKAKRDILDLHENRNGYCKECGGGWPCLTLQWLVR